MKTLICVLFLLIKATPVNAYNHNNDVIVCDSEDTCWHEAAHAMDSDMGYPSRTAEFADECNKIAAEESHAFAVGINLFPGVLGNDTWNIGLFYPHWGGYSELYADMMMWADGDVSRLPPSLQQFYDQALFDAALDKLIIGPAGIKYTP